MTKKYIIVLLAAGVFAAAAAIVITKNNQQAGNEMLPVDLHALKMDDGWGYEVLVGKKVFIHQDCIPAISAFKKFNNQADALAVGNRVMEKLKKGQKPSVSLQEIDELHILY